MPRYKEAGGGREDEDAPCECKECACETVSACIWPFNDECRCSGTCCDTTKKNDDNHFLSREKELVAA